MTTRPGDLAEVLRSTGRALDEVDAHVDALRRTVESVLADLPAGAVAGARAEVAALGAESRAVVAQLRGMLATAGDPAGLRVVADGWIGIGGAVSRLVGVASDAVLQTDDHWTGAAADAYRATLPAQRIALAAVVTTCQEIDATLDELAAAILQFWIAIGAACLGLVLALAGALGCTATAVGVPAAAGIALAGVGALVAAGSSALSNLTEITAAATARSAALHRRLSDSTAYPLGEWPRAALLPPGASGWQPR